MAVDLSANIKGIKFKNPFLVASGPTVKRLDQIKAASDSGWAGATIKAVIDPFPYLNLPPRYRWLDQEKIHIFTAERRLKADQGLRLLEDGLKLVRDDFNLMVNLTYTGEDYEGWGKLAKRFADAGARAIELNMCCPNMSFNLSATGQETQKCTGASLGNDLENLPHAIKIVTESVNVPIIVKFYAGSHLLTEAARVAIEAGAAAVGHSGNILGIPDIDIYRPQESIYRLQDQITLGCISGPWIRPLALKATFEIRGALGPEGFVIGSGGVNDLESAVQQIMVGSDMTWVCVQTMLRGYDWLPKLLEDMEKYMSQMGYNSIRDFRDVLRGNIVSAQGLTVHEGYAEIDNERCVACGLCVKIGHCPAIACEGGKPSVDQKACLGCSTCVDICPKQALRMKRWPAA